MRLRVEREFDPKDIDSDDEDGFQEALRCFRKDLDRQYPLCMKCEFTLTKNELGKYNPFYSKWVENVKQRTRSGTNDFLAAVESDNCSGVDVGKRSRSRRTFNYLLCFGSLFLVDDSFVAFLVSKTAEEIYFPSVFVENSDILSKLVYPGLFVARICVILFNSQSRWFGTVLRAHWLVDVLMFCFIESFGRNILENLESKIQNLTLLVRVIIGFWTIINCFATIMANTLEDVDAKTEKNINLDYTENNNFEPMSSGSLTPPTGSTVISQG